MTRDMNGKREDNTNHDSSIAPNGLIEVAMVSGWCTLLNNQFWVNQYFLRA